jgi:hypothetical protein
VFSLSAAQTSTATDKMCELIDFVTSATHPLINLRANQLME